MTIDPLYEGRFVNEIPDILRAALTSTQTLTFGDDEEARSWQFRAYQHIRRRAPEMKQLMISRRGREVKVRVPQFTITQGE